MTNSPATKKKAAEFISSEMRTDQWKEAEQATGRVETMINVLQLVSTSPAYLRPIKEIHYKEVFFIIKFITGLSGARQGVHTEEL